MSFVKKKCEEDVSHEWIDSDVAVWSDFLNFLQIDKNLEDYISPSTPVD
jgi:hypothetical protein